MEFNSLTKRISEAFGVEPPPPGEAPPRPVAAQQAHGRREPQAEKAAPASGPAAELRRVQDWLRSVPFDHAGYTQVTDLQTLEDWIAAATEQGFVAFDTETTDLDAVAARLCGVALALEPNRACYIPLAHRAGDGLDFTGAGEIAQLPLEQAIPRLKALLEDESVLKIGQNIKYDLVVMRRYGVRLCALRRHHADGLCGGPGPGGLAGFGMDELSKRHLGHTPITFADVAGKGKTQVTIRLRARGQGDRIFRRGRGRDLAAVAPVQGAARGGRDGGGLRDAGAAHARDPGRNGACGRHGGQGAALAAFGRIRAKPRALRGRDLCAWRAAHSISARRCRSRICCSASSACRARKKTATGKWSTGAKVLEDLVASEDLTPDQRCCREAARMAAARQAQEHLHRLAAPAYRRGNRPHPHLLCAGLHLDRAAVLDRAEPAKHPRPHQGRPANPHRLHRGARQEAYLGRL